MILDIRDLFDAVRVRYRPLYGIYFGSDCCVISRVWSHQFTCVMVDVYERLMYKRLYQLPKKFILFSHQSCKHDCGRSRRLIPFYTAGEKSFLALINLIINKRGINGNVTSVDFLFTKSRRRDNLLFEQLLVLWSYFQPRSSIQMKSLWKFRIHRVQSNLQNSWTTEGQYEKFNIEVDTLKFLHWEFR